MARKQGHEGEKAMVEARDSGITWVTSNELNLAESEAKKAREWGERIQARARELVDENAPDSVQFSAVSPRDGEYVYTNTREAVEAILQSVQESMPQMERGPRKFYEGVAKELRDNLKGPERRA